ncbi:MarR family winged helix-turn-helix transcriptional regulator [Tenggerimyces flavus]|uniref:MarR family winged helix-turn-helix transcriptional regulator n=1 Tax=Tenggerimyces flavus TaxID=1708749 RepID=A0ABV7Y5S3_9ACTN|nr:MarR family transcriptional regulator [Tenggerimyces flavus]MBM7788283.1 DNA-binding MarR family transcriptional regulator [Tenggerimyces flavus]
MTSDTPATAVLGLLQGISMVLAEDLAEFAEREGMTPARVHLLWALGEEGAMPSHRLAKRLDVTPRTVTGLVDRLAESGHVTRSAHPDDRRSTLVTPTKKGDAFTARLQAMQDELLRDLFTDFPAERLEPLRIDLTRLFERMQELVAAAKQH